MEGIGAYPPPFLEWSLAQVGEETSLSAPPPLRSIWRPSFTIDNNNMIIINSRDSGSPLVGAPGKIEGARDGVFHDLKSLGREIKVGPPQSPRIHSVRSIGRDLLWDLLSPHRCQLATRRKR
ncbi:hypothetical protein ACMYSQ_009550 [Aspergillus niger]